MAKNKKTHHRPGPGKPRGATYAQVLAHKAAVRKGLEQAARDATVQVQADTHTQRAMWLMVCSIADAYGFGPKQLQKFFTALQDNTDELEGCGQTWTRNMPLKSSARRRRRSPAWRCITSTSRRLCWLRCRRPRRGCQPMSKRIIQTTPSGEWMPLPKMPVA